MTRALTTRFHGLTDPGLQRSHNDDGFSGSPDDGLYLVVDGMGGGGSGDIATQIALDAAREGFRAAPSRPAGERLASAVQLANLRVFERSERDMHCRGMGAAIAAVALEGETVHVAHAGDCRVYRHRPLDLEPLTRDHSLVNDYILHKPDLTEAEIAALPRNVITRALGMQREIAVELRAERARPGDLFLLSSDGLHATIGDEAIAGILYDAVDLEAACRALLAAALEQGAPDNVTCLLIRCALA